MKNTQFNEIDIANASSNFGDRGLVDFLKSNEVPQLSESLITYLQKGSLNDVSFDKTLLNNQRHLNKYLIATNASIALNTYYIGSVETLENWRKRRTSRNIFIIGFFVRVWDFIFKRIAPKVWGVKRIYFAITKGKGRLLSKAEALGRLVSCGFEIIDIKNFDNKHYFIVKKVGKPIVKKPSYGPVFKMKRVGKGGKIIGVYKLRTMHPYSEFIQEYIVKTNGYGENGKVKDDYRLSKWAKLIRKYWLDEIPQILNLLKGDMKLVGVRPVSPTYFEEIPEDLRQLRLKYKPGCIPPYVAFNKSSSVKSVLDCERQYLEMKTKNPYTTDFKLFFKAIFNIIFRGKRSA